MSERPTVLVCGHGRCGSSLVMQMMQAGGYPCFGNFPAFEPKETGFDRDINSLLKLIEGHSAKIIDPQINEWTDLKGVCVVWLSRDRNEQAASQLKFLRIIGGINAPPGSKRQFSKSYGPDTAEALRRLTKAGATVLRLQFEAILANPWSAAASIRNFVGVSMDVEAMAACRIERHPACQEGLDIEELLCARVIR